MELHIYKMEGLYDELLFLNTVRNQYAFKFLHDSRVFTLDETEKWFYNTKPLYFIIKHITLNSYIGYFRLSNYSEYNKNIYIGADIAPEFKGKGYAKPAYKWMINFLFNEYNLNKISLEVLSTNTVAINLYNSLGFITEGIKRQEILKDGIWIDSIVMSILKNEYVES